MPTCVLRYCTNNSRNSSKSTGASFHQTSIIDLYTIEGKKIQGPLELSHGTFYVAVEKAKDFIDAGYEKYLIKASRSWEKRQAQRDNTEEKPSDLNKSEKEQDEQPGEQNMKTQEESVLLKTIISSEVENESSVVVSPLSVSNSEKKPDAQSNVTTVKSVEKKRISIQRPAFIKKNSPNVPNQPAVSNIKPPFKRNGLKSTNVTILSKPENDRGIKTTKVPIRSKFYKPMNTPKQPPIAEMIMSSAHQVIGEKKIASSIKIDDENNQNVFTKAAEIKNAIEDKEVVVVSNIYKNPQKESSSVTVDVNGPSIIVNPDLTRNDPKEYTMLNLNMNLIPSTNNVVQPYEASANQSHSRKENKLIDITLPDEIPPMSILKHDYGISKSSENPNHISISEEPPLSKVKANCNIILEDSSSRREIASNKMEKCFSNNDPTSQENVIRNQIYNDNYYQPNSNNMDTIDNNENLKHQENPSKKSLNLIHRMSSVLSSKVTKQATNVREIDEIVQENFNIDDVLITSLKTNDGNKQCDSKNPNDEYMTILNKGDTVNLKLSIEIKKDDNLITNKVKCDANPKEKASQIDSLSNNIVEHKCLLSLIIQDVEKDQQEGKHSVIIVHCKGCKFCKDPKITKDTISIHRNEVPHKVRENLDTKSCPYQESRDSMVNPVKTVISSISIEKLKKVSRNFSTEISPNNIRNLTDDPGVENIKSDKEILTRKSIIIENVLANKEPKVSEVITADCATQTDWREVLLEVKEESDDHYTFFLPSLETLKYLKLL